MSLEVPTIDDIRAAATRIAGHAHRTPVFTCASLDELTGAHLFFKCENFQKTGAFKFRGALNAVASLPDDQAQRGVVTHSSGNHAAAVALAARTRGIPAHIVMPANASVIKQRAVVGYGGNITFCEDSLASRQATAARVLEATGGVLVHPYDDPAVIAGQGTVGLEVLEQVPEPDWLIAPVSGGGLICGVALAAAAVSPRTQTLGVEPVAADDAARSLQAGRPLPLERADTIADGLRAALSERTFTIIQRHVNEIFTVSEQAIVSAMRLVWERIKLVIEPSAAVGLAAVLDHPDRGKGRRIAIILSGGNVDLEKLSWNQS